MKQQNIIPQDILDAIYAALKEHGKLKIKGLGTFELKHIAGRETYNPYTKGRGYMEGYIKVKFKASSILKKQING